MAAMAGEVERSELEQANRNGGSSRLLVALVVALVVIAGGLGGWVLYDQTRETATALSDEIAQVLDDYLRAFEERDEAALTEVVTEDYLLTQHVYETGPDGLVLEDTYSQALTHVLGLSFLFEWEVEHLGEALVVGENPWMVSVEENWVTPKGFLVDHRDGVASYVIVDEGGTLKIADHYWTGLRYDTE